MAKNKVIIAMPVAEMFQVKTTFSLVHAFRALKADADFIIQRSCDIIGNRVWLVREAIKREGTHIMFIDHDMFFPPDAIQKLVDHKKDIVGASYFKRKLPLEGTEVAKEGEDTTKLFKCEVIGTGFLLIDLKVFEKIPEPWFQFGRGADGQLVYGEDAYFSQQAIKAGFDVWADPNLGVKHIGEYLF